MLHAILITLAATQLAVDPPQTRTIEFEEQWRTDPYSDEYLMGNVTDVAIDDDGNFYFLDNQLQEVFKFDSEGNYIATVARKGEGPGELDQTWSITWWGPDAIILPRTFPAKVIRISPDGTPLDELHVYRNPEDDTKASIGDLVPVGDHAVVSGSLFQFGSDGSKHVRWLGVIDRVGTVVHEFGGFERELPADPMQQLFDERAEFWEWNRWAATDGGHVFRVPDREKWLIERYDLEGNLTATFERDIPARPRTREETDELMDSRSFFFNGQKAKVTYKLLETEPPIGGLRVVGDQLWVIHNPAEYPDGVWRQVSVLTFDGEFVEDIELRVEHDPDLDFTFQLKDGRVMVIENGVAAQAAQWAAFDGGEEEEDEDLSDAEPAEIVIYAPMR